MSFPRSLLKLEFLKETTMERPLSVLGIIPARGGSKGIPGKNLIDINGVPLIGLSIQTGSELLKLGAISRLIVSTDSDQIAETARTLGCEVPFMRPEAIATDEAKSALYVEHALEQLELSDQCNQYEAVMILQPTSPLRNAEKISGATEQFLASNSNSMISCYEECYINDLVMYYRDAEGLLRPKLEKHQSGTRRQDHGGVMVRNGCLYVVRTEYFKTTGQLICDRPMLMEMPKRESVNVDSMEDLELLRSTLCK